MTRNERQLGTREQLTLPQGTIVGELQQLISDGEDARTLIDKYESYELSRDAFQAATKLDEVFIEALEVQKYAHEVALVAGADSEVASEARAWADTVSKIASRLGASSDQLVADRTATKRKRSVPAKEYKATQLKIVEHTVKERDDQIAAAAYDAYCQSAYAIPASALKLSKDGSDFRPEKSNLGRTLTHGEKFAGKIAVAAAISSVGAVSLAPPAYANMDTASVKIDDGPAINPSDIIASPVVQIKGSPQFKDIAKVNQVDIPTAEEIADEGNEKPRESRDTAKEIISSDVTPDIPNVNTPVPLVVQVPQNGSIPKEKAIEIVPVPLQEKPEEPKQSADTDQKTDGPSETDAPEKNEVDSPEPVIVQVPYDEKTDNVEQRIAPLERDAPGVKFVTPPSDSEPPQQSAAENAEPEKKEKAAEKEAPKKQDKPVEKAPSKSEVDKNAEKARDAAFKEYIITLASQADKAMDPNKLYDLLNEAEKNNPHKVIDREFIMSIAWQESRFDPKAVSHATAMGLTQFMPGTASEWVKGDPFNPADSLDASFRYYAYIYDMMEDRFPNKSQADLIDLTLAGYNAGPWNPSILQGQVPNLAEPIGYINNIVPTIKEVNSVQKTAEAKVRDAAKDAAEAAKKAAAKKKADAAKKAADAKKKAAEKKEQEAKIVWGSPVDGTINSGFKTPERPSHNGVDYNVPAGTPFRAVQDGIAYSKTFSALAPWCQSALAEFNAPYPPADPTQKTVLITHEINGKTYTSRYDHLSEIDIVEGQKVKAGDIIGKTGNSGCSTGPHAHFGIFEGEEALNPEKLIGRHAH